MIRRAILCLGTLGLFVGLAAQDAAAQQRGAQGQAANPSAQQAPDTIRLVLEREVFSYPTFQRRNPFSPLTGRDDGPRFEDLVLLGVIQTADTGASVALIGTRGGADGGRTYRVRVGERLGNSRFIEIRRQEVVAEVEEFGLSEARTLQLRRTEPRPDAPTEGAGTNQDNADEEPSSDGDPNSGPEAGDYVNGGSS